MSRTPDDGLYVIDPPEYIPNQASAGVDAGTLRDAMPDAAATMTRTAAQVDAAVRAATRRPG